MLFLSTKEEYARQGITNGMFGVIVAKDEVLSAEHKDRYEETTYWKVKFDTDSGEKIVSVYFNHMLPIRDDELDAYKQKIASELKKKADAINGELTCKNRKAKGFAVFFVCKWANFGLGDTGAALCIKNSGKNHTLYRRKNERRDERWCDRDKSVARSGALG